MPPLSYLPLCKSLRPSFLLLSCYIPASVLGFLKTDSVDLLFCLIFLLITLVFGILSKQFNVHSHGSKGHSTPSVAWCQRWIVPWNVARLKRLVRLKHSSVSSQVARRRKGTHSAKRDTLGLQSTRINTHSNLHDDPRPCCPVAKHLLRKHPPAMWRSPIN